MKDKEFEMQSNNDPQEAGFTNIDDMFNNQQKAIDKIKEAIKLLDEAYMLIFDDKKPNYEFVYNSQKGWDSIKIKNHDTQKI